MVGHAEYIMNFNRTVLEKFGKPEFYLACVRTQSRMHVLVNEHFECSSRSCINYRLPTAYSVICFSFICIIIK